MRRLPSPPPDLHRFHASHKVPVKAARPLNNNEDGLSRSDKSSLCNWISHPKILLRYELRVDIRPLLLLLLLLYEYGILGRNTGLQNAKRMSLMSDLDMINKPMLLYEVLYFCFV